MTVQKQNGRQSGRGRLRLYRWLTVATAPLLFLAAIEGVLRLCDYGYDPRFFRHLTIDGDRYFVQNDAFNRRFFPPRIARYPNGLRVQAAKPDDTVRLFILGESAAMGDPLPAYGPARYLEVLLRQRYPAVDFDVVNLAYTAINSHVILPIARECAALQGDLWIIYMGNNEMIGPFGASSAFGDRAPTLGRIRTSLFLQRFRLGQWIATGTSRWKGTDTSFANWSGMEMFLKNEVAPSDPRRTTVKESFRRNLEDIVLHGIQAGAKVLLCTVAVNLRDCPPFAAMADANLAPDVRAQCESLLQKARTAQDEADLRQAADHLQVVTTLDPGHALAHYERGRSLLELAQTTDATTAFQRACDTDALCFRTVSGWNRIIRDTAAAQDSSLVRLVDTGAALGSLANVTSLGSETFYEHVHFNPDGAYRLGLTWAQEVETALANRLPTTPEAGWASPEDCDTLLGVNPWNRARVLQAMVKRFQSPPLSSQPNNPIRVQALQQEIEHLRTRCNADNAEIARRHFLAATAHTPESTLLLGEQAAFMMAIGDEEGAQAVWQQVRALIPHDYLPIYQLGVLAAAGNRPAEAERYLRHALAIRPSFTQGWIELGRLLASQHRWEPARMAFAQVAKLQPWDPVSWAKQASMQAAQGKTGSALELYRKALDLDPDAWEVHVALGGLQANQGQRGSAMASYREALRLNPGHALTHVNLGTLLVQQGNLEEAIDHFETAIRIDPDIGVAREYLNRTKDYLRQSR